MLLEHGISLVPIDNEAILDQVLSNDVIAYYYFDHCALPKSWFEEKFKNSLSSLGPRYNHEFNVKTHAEHLFDLFLEDSDAVVQINSIKKELIASLEQKKKQYPCCSDAIHKLIGTIASLEDVKQHTIKDCLSWPTVLRETCQSEFDEISKLLSKAKDAYAAAKEKDDRKILTRLFEEINDLTYLLLKNKNTIKNLLVIVVLTQSIFR